MADRRFVRRSRNGCFSCAGVREQVSMERSRVPPDSEHQHVCFCVLARRGTAAHGRDFSEYSEDEMESPVARRELLKWSMGALTLGLAKAAPRKPMHTVLLADPICKEHDTGFGHPERPERFDAVTHGLDRAGLMKSLGRIESRLATDDEIVIAAAKVAPTYLAYP